MSSHCSCALAGKHAHRHRGGGRGCSAAPKQQGLRLCQQTAPGSQDATPPVGALQLAAQLGDRTSTDAMAGFSSMQGYRGRSQDCQVLGVLVGGGDGTNQVVVSHVEVGQVGQVLHPGAWQAALEAVALQLHTARQAQPRHRFGRCHWCLNGCYSGWQVTGPSSASARCLGKEAVVRCSAEADMLEQTAPPAWQAQQL